MHTYAMLIPTMLIFLTTASDSRLFYRVAMKIVSKQKLPVSQKCRNVFAPKMLHACLAGSLLRCFMPYLLNIKASFTNLVLCVGIFLLPHPL